MVFIAIITMTIRKKFLKRKVEINKQYEVELDSYDGNSESMCELDDQLKKTLGELPHVPIYDYIDELSIEDFKIEEECEDIHQQSCSSTLQEESTLKTNELVNSLENCDDYVTMNAVIIPDN